MKKFFLLTILITLLYSNSNSQPYPYTLPIMINNGGSAATNVQVLIRLDTETFITANLMKADGGDIRFYDSPGLTTQLDYYLEGYIDTDSTKLWVLLPSLPAGVTNIYCNFGNMAANSTSTLSIFDGPHSAIDSLSGGNVNTSSGIWNSSRGFRFASTQDILITDFGKNEPNGTTRFVTLWHYNSQQIVLQNQVSGGIGVWSYDSLDQSFWIQQGVQYIISLFQGTNEGYYWQSSSQVGSHITYFDMRYCNSCTQNTFPTTVLSNLQYGYPDFLYYTRTAISPAPVVTIGSLTGITNGNTIPDKYELYQNYPNPFNPTTTIRYDIPEENHVKITVYDMLGREVSQLVNEIKTAGSYEIIWNGINQSSGIYFYKIEAGDFTKQVKMILVK